MSNDRGALSANVIKTAEVCFLSAAQDVMKEAICLGNTVFETNLRLKNDLTYSVLRKCTCKTYENRLYKNLDANLYHGAKNVVLIRSLMIWPFMFYWPSAMLSTVFLFSALN